MKWDLTAWAAGQEAGRREQEARRQEMKIMLTEVRHAELLSRFHLENAERFRPWSPGVDAEYHSLPSWEQRLRQRRLEFEQGLSAHFIGLDDAQSEILGACSLTGIVRGPLQACHLGYSVAGKYEGCGIMSAIVREVVDYAFKELGLNRIMANYMPANTRSAALLERLGFEREGYARRYLKINGRWEDHVLTSLLNPVGYED